MLFLHGPHTLAYRGQRSCRKNYDTYSVVAVQRSHIFSRKEGEGLWTDINLRMRFHGSGSLAHKGQRSCAKLLHVRMEEISPYTSSMVQRSQIVVNEVRKGGMMDTCTLTLYACVLIYVTSCHPI
jgi:hypothetical protein